MDAPYPGVHIFPMGDNDSSAPGDRPTNCPLPVSSLEDLKGKLVSESMDPYGCQFWHHKLQERKREDIRMIFSEVKDLICQLMLDNLGSYLLQKLYEVCDEEQMTQLVYSVTANVRLLMDVCMDSQGSESMKKFLGLMTPKQIFHMISVFTYVTVPLVNHQFGSRVIDHCFKIFPGDETESMVLVIADNDCMEFATDEYGCQLLQVILSEASVPWNNSRRRIFAKLVSGTNELSTDQFGYLVVQHLIGLKSPFVAEYIKDSLTGLFTVMSMLKYGSVIVKKLMKAANGKYASEITNYIIGSRHFLSVLVDPYGFDVLQCALTYSDRTVQKTLNHQISQHSELLELLGVSWRPPPRRFKKRNIITH